MSAFHVPARDPYRLLGGPMTELGRRALRWLVWSFGMLVPIVIAALVWEAIRPARRLGATAGRATSLRAIIRRSLSN